MGHEESTADEKKLFAGVFLVALATLVFEVALIRVLSFTIWYHFAYVVLSTALLGFGASGTLLALRPSLGSRDLHRSLTLLSVASGLCFAAVIGFVSLFPLHPTRIFDDPGTLLLLLAYQLAATLPFLLSGLVISLSLRSAARRVDRLYFWDLLGAGLGCASAVLLMNAISPPGAALAAAAFAAAGGAAFSRSAGARNAAAGVAALLLLASFFAARLPFTPAESKFLAAQIPSEALEPVLQRWTALFRTDLHRLTTTEGPDGKPAPPRSDEWGTAREVPRSEIQAPWGLVSHDASAGTAVYDLRTEQLEVLDRHVLKVPYSIVNPNPKVLVIGVGGGRDVIAARHFGASHVTGVELDPVAIRILRQDLAQLSNGMFDEPMVTLVPGEGRHFVKRTHQRFDLIQMTGIDTLAATAQGAYVLAENYLYTVEAIEDYLDRLAPRGVLAIGVGHWSSNRPQTEGRMLSVVREALVARGVKQPERQIAVISQSLMAVVMVRNEPFTRGQLEALEADVDRLGFAPLLLGARGHENYRRIVTAQGEERERMFEEFSFLLRPIWDDRPFFFRFFRWRDLPSSRELSPHHNTALGQWVLAVLLVSLTALGALFVLAPLVVFRRRRIVAGPEALGVMAYFLAIGLGFMLFEISLLQRFALYLGYPTYSLSVVLFSLLTSLGIGSFFSRRFVGKEARVLPAALLVVAGLTLFYARGLPQLQELTLGSALAVRVLLSVLVLAPLGLCFGIFFPLGIRRAEALHPDLVPWAWGINGCASVTATVLAVVLAMSIGFQGVWVLSLAIYAAGTAAFLLSARSRPGAAGRPTA